MSRLFNIALPFSGGYKHFNSLIPEFYGEHRKYKIASINNHCIDFSRLGDVRVSRFVRVGISSYLDISITSEPRNLGATFQIQRMPIGEL